MVAPAYVVPCGAALALLGAALTGCSQPVAVEAPAMTPECEAILATAPVKAASELQRETQPRDAAAVAWGDPPIVLTCGGQSAPLPDAQVIEIEGIDWVIESSDVGTVFTSMDTSPTVQVRVPVDYRPEASVVSELAAQLSIGDIATAVS